MRPNLGILALTFGTLICVASPLWAQGNDPIADTFNRAANTPQQDKQPEAPPQPAETAPPQEAATLPPLPDDPESLKALTEALAADKSGMDEKDIKTRAFENALNGMFPLTPEQVKELMRRMAEAQEAGRSPPEPMPKPVVRVENVSLDPGVSPPLIQVAQGYVTTVNMLDVTGEPWPVQDVVIGGNFKVTGPNDANVLRIIPGTRYGRGNLSIRLVGLSTPVTFRIEAGGDEVYYRYDARVPQSGPGAKSPIISQGFQGQAGDSNLMGVLEGVAPSGAKKMKITGADGRTRAWKINDLVYLRTPLTLLSPAWDASVRSADGTNVYVLADAPVLMLSDNGQMIRAKVVAPPEDPFRPDDLKDGKITVPVEEPPTMVPSASNAPAANSAVPSTQPVGGQAGLELATQPPMGGSISEEAAARRNRNQDNRNGVQIYRNTGGVYQPSSGGQ